jgi:hypothetical protein
LQRQFSLANRFNYDFNHVMFYDNAVGGENYSWTQTEVQHMRDWFNNNGHQDVGLIWNARNFSVAKQNCSKIPLVDHVMIEGSDQEFERALALLDKYHLADNTVVIMRRITGETANGKSLAVGLRSGKYFIW